MKTKKKKKLNKLPEVPGKRKKVRNYSFASSQRLPVDKMTEINSLRIPSIPGSCYHAIMCALAQNKEKFCTWDKIIELTEYFMCKYGGNESWITFKEKSNVKSYQTRIKENVHTLTRNGKDCYGHRLHERGMSIYFFKDGAMLLAGGTFYPTSDSGGVSYGVRFADGRGIQVRYRGSTMTYAEYKKFLDLGYINPNGSILEAQAIRDYRYTGDKRKVTEIPQSKNESEICVKLSEDFDQDTANRLEHLGFVVKEAREHELVGTISSLKLPELEIDPDVLDVVSV